MNILHIIDTTGPGGAETVFIELAHRLRQRGHRSIAIVRGPGWVHDQLKRLDIETIILDIRGAFNLKLVWALRRILLEKNIDVIQSHLLGANLYSSIAGWISNTPVVGTFHGMVDIGENERFRKIKLWLMNRGLSASVSVSRSLMDFIAKNRLLNEKRAHIIYNGIDLAKYARNDNLELRKQLSISTNAIVLGCLGNIRPAKAYPVLIQAISFLETSYPELHVVVAGHQKSALMAELDSQIASLGLEDRIHFVGFQQDSSEFLSNLDLFVLCSDSEGFSISTIEAMATGLPVIATRCGGPEEIITHNNDGMLVEKSNPEKLAQGIDSLLKDEGLQNKLSTNARATAETRFSLTTMLDSYEKLYKNIVN